MTEEVLSRFKSNPEYAAERSKLAAMLRALPMGGVLKYEDATAAIGRDIQGDARISLMRARDMVEKEDGTIRFGTISGLGVKRLPESEVPSIGSSARARARHAIQKGYRRLSGASVNDPVAAHQNRVQLSYMGALALALKDRNAKTVDAAVTRAGAEIPAAVVLGLFSS